MEKTYHKQRCVVWYVVCGVRGAGNQYKRTECIIGVLYIIYELRHLLSIYINTVIIYSIMIMQVSDTVYQVPSTTDIYHNTRSKRSPAMLAPLVFNEQTEALSILGAQRS